MSAGAAVAARHVGRHPFLAPHEDVRLVEAKRLLLVVRRGAVAVERRRDHHRVREGRGPRAGGAGRGHEGAEVEEGPEGEEGWPGGERLQVAGGGVTGQRPVGAAVSTATAGAADTRGGAVRRTLIRGGGGARRRGGAGCRLVGGAAGHCSHGDGARHRHGNVST